MKCLFVFILALAIGFLGGLHAPLCVNMDCCKLPCCVKSCCPPEAMKCPYCNPCMKCPYCNPKGCCDK